MNKRERLESYLERVEVLEPQDRDRMVELIKEMMQEYDQMEEVLRSFKDAASRARDLILEEARRDPRTARLIATADTPIGGMVIGQ